jgi:L-ascorbate metabolism protein UlaG (beta-lactamase superfamily)
MLLTRHATPAFLAVAIAGGALLPDRADPPAIRVRWLGHAAFEIVSPGGTRLLIDPWLLENPSTPARHKDTTRWARPDARPSAILATHPHSDHDGDVPLLARVSGAKVVATGDTWVFGDMALIERFFHPWVILLATGGGRAGEDPEVAAFAVRAYFKPRAIVPMHYGTSVVPFASEAEVRAAFRGDRRFQVLAPGEDKSF